MDAWRELRSDLVSMPCSADIEYLLTTIAAK